MGQGRVELQSFLLIKNEMEIMTFQRGDLICSSR